MLTFQPWPLCIINGLLYFVFLLKWLCFLDTSYLMIKMLVQFEKLNKFPVGQYVNSANNLIDKYIDICNCFFGLLINAETQ